MKTLESINFTSATMFITSQDFQHIRTACLDFGLTAFACDSKSAFNFSMLLVSVFNAYDYKAIREIIQIPSVNNEVECSQSNCLVSKVQATFSFQTFQSYVCRINRSRYIQVSRIDPVTYRSSYSEDSMN